MLGSLSWHFDLGRMVPAGALGYGCFWEALQRPLCRGNGARKFVWHFDFGRVVLAVSGCCTWVWVLLGGVTKTIVPREWC